MGLKLRSLRPHSPKLSLRKDTEHLQGPAAKGCVAPKALLEWRGDWLPLSPKEGLRLVLELPERVF